MVFRIISHCSGVVHCSNECKSGLRTSCGTDRLFLYIFHERWALGIPFCYISMFKEPWALLGFGLTLTYNGERGKQNKLVNYLFYPVHLLILGIIRMYLGI